MGSYMPVLAAESVLNLYGFVYGFSKREVRTCLIRRLVPSQHHAKYIHDNSNSCQGTWPRKPIIPHPHFFPSSFSLLFFFFSSTCPFCKSMSFSAVATFKAILLCLSQLIHHSHVHTLLLLFLFRLFFAMLSNVAASPRASPPCSSTSSSQHVSCLSFCSFTAPPPPLSSVASSQVSPALAQGSSGSAHGHFGRLVQDAFSIAGSRLPRVRPSSTGSPVEHRFTFDFGGYAVPAATLESMRKFSSSFPVLFLG